MKIRGVVGLGVLGMLSGCGGDAVQTGGEENTSAVMESIIGGVPASPTYPEAAILNMTASSGLGYACSASIIAPKVVLTAGHCVDGMVSWTVTAGANLRTSTRGETFDWKENGATTVNPNHHDIGLVYLTDAIVLSSYPVLAQAKVADGTTVLNVGRILNGVLTNNLYDAPVVVKDGAAMGYPFDYASGLVIEHGDSGGPVFVNGTHSLVAVNSGAGSGTQVLARVDLVYAWIQQRIAAQSAADAGVDASKDAGPIDSGVKPADAGVVDSGVKPADAGVVDSGVKPADAGVADAGAAPDAGACTQETEVNDSFTSANTVASVECGSLTSGTDQDWFTFPLPVGTSTVSLVPSGDAAMMVGYVTGSTCVPALTLQRSVRITVSGAAIKGCVSVTSAGHQAQTYRLAH